MNPKEKNYERAFRCTSRTGPVMIVDLHRGSDPHVFLNVKIVDSLIAMNKGGGTRLGNR